MNAGERLKLIDYRQRALTEAKDALAEIGKTGRAMKDGILALRPLAGHPIAVAAVEKLSEAVVHVEAMADAMDRLIGVLTEEI
jgi:hypothetical protein